jgi:hypothetical protein
VCKVSSGSAKGRGRISPVYSSPPTSKRGSPTFPSLSHRAASPFARAIYAKVIALRYRTNSPAQHQRLREPITVDLHKCSDVLTPDLVPAAVGQTAASMASALGTDLSRSTWQGQKKFDPRPICLSLRARLPCRTDPRPVPCGDNGAGDHRDHPRSTARRVNHEGRGQAPERIGVRQQASGSSGSLRGCGDCPPGGAEPLRTPSNRDRRRNDRR